MVICYKVFALSVGRGRIHSGVLPLLSSNSRQQLGHEAILTAAVLIDQDSVQMFKCSTVVQKVSVCVGMVKKFRIRWSCWDLELLSSSEVPGISTVGYIMEIHGVCTNGRRII